jgi:P27 family predicted phage terminase small subunit
MNNKLPESLNIVHRNPKTVVKVKDIVSRPIPNAEWLENPKKWNEINFIKETADFLVSVYGSISTQDRHLLAMLAVEISQYVECLEGIKKDGIIATFNNGKTPGANPYVSVKNDTITKILAFMNQLGLSPKDRLKNGVKEPTEESEFLRKLMKGPDFFE